jgi:hypothetical protein
MKTGRKKLEFNIDEMTDAEVIAFLEKRPRFFRDERFRERIKNMRNFGHIVWSVKHCPNVFNLINLKELNNNELYILLEKVRRKAHEQKIIKEIKSRKNN